MRARAREGFGVTDVRDAGDVHKKAVEANPESRMDASAPFTEVEIPFKSFLVADLLHLLFEDLVTFFSLGTTDDFPFARNEAIASGDGLPVIVFPHIEGFDFLRVVDEEHRPLDHFLGQITFMFRLEIHAPFDVGVFEFMSGLNGILKDFDAFRVFHFGERGTQNAVQLIQKARGDHAIEEFHFIRALIEGVLNKELDGFFHESHIIIEIREGDFRFNHPELACVAGGVGFLSAEGRAESINIAESHGEGLDVKLTRHRERSAATEEIRIAQFALIVRSRDREDLTSALGIVCRDFRRVNVDKAFALEEFMNAKGKHGAKTVKRGEGVRTGAEIRFVAEIFKGVALLLEGVIRGAFTKDFDRGDMHFERLFHLRGHGDGAMDADRRSSQKMRDDIVILEVTVIDELDVFEASPVIEGNEADGTGIAVRPNPAGKVDIAKFRKVFFGGEARIQFSNGGEFWLHTVKGYPFVLLLQSGKEA